MTLSYQLYDIMKPRLQTFATGEGIDLAIRQAACSTSSSMLQQKEVDIANFCCSPAATDRLPGIEFQTIGIIPVAIFIHPDNPVDNISLHDLMRVFRGEINNWRELGGRDLFIQPVARIHCKTRHGRWRPLDHPGDLSPTTLMVGALSDNLDFVSTTPGSIGYETLLMVEPYRREQQIKYLHIDGKDPRDLEALAKGRYPYYRTYTFTLWTDPRTRSADAEKILRFIDRDINNIQAELGIIPAASLRQAGWRFSGKELVGEPDDGRNR